MELDRQAIARAVMALMNSNLSETDKAQIALFLTAPLMGSQAFEVMMAGVTDSKFERESHERTKAEIRAIFEGLTSGLDQISEDDWQKADESKGDDE